MTRFLARRGVLLIVSGSLVVAGAMLSLAPLPVVSSGEGPTLRAVREAPGAPLLVAAGAFEDFGAVDVSAGPLPNKRVTIYNYGAGALVIDDLSLGGANPTAFRYRSGSGDDCFEGQSLAQFENCRIRVGFNPGRPGSEVGDDERDDERRLARLPAQRPGHGADGHLGSPARVRPAGGQRRPDGHPDRPGAEQGRRARDVPRHPARRQPRRVLAPDRQARRLQVR